MVRRVGAALAVLASVTQGMAAQDALQAVYDSAYYAWDAGRYPEALRTFQRLLATGDAFLEDIAVLTGELYHTSELSPDGTRPAWSGDGRLVAYETPSGAPTRTHIVALEAGGTRVVTEFPGTGARFSPDGRSVVYLQLQDGPELQRALAEVRASIQVRNRADFARVRRAVARVNGEHTKVVVRELASGREREVATPELGVTAVMYGVDGETLHFLGNERGNAARTDIYTIRANATARRVTSAPGNKTSFQVIPGGTHAVYTTADASFAVVDLAIGEERRFPGTFPAPSRDGSAIAFIGNDGRENTINVMRLGGDPVEVERTPLRLANPSLSPNGDRVVYQAMLREDWELMVVAADGSGRRRLSHEIQHDLFPRFLSDDLILAVIGEGRHRRSYLYDFDTGARARLFHNNTIRTVAPEYEWVASPDGSKVVIVSERDGDTISPERGVYVVDLDRRLAKDDIVERLNANLAAEEDLRERGAAIFAAVADQVRATVADVSTARIYKYEKDLFAFGSKFITQPGNAMAIEYIAATLRSFGYEPELQWFEPRPGVPSANIIATLRGTVDPDLVYALSSHFDSVERGPGADDNTSGTTALLEAARVLAGKPQPATIKFLFFTGEEAGLLGSREYMRQAVAAGDKIVGALNNDMVGFANDNRLDNTIRYSNNGIRDVQHAAAFLFTDLITYDAKYYKSTDAHAYYDAYGDIVGGIGSYPILGNPHYHQVHDVLETIDHQLVAEVSKTTVATLILLASSPSRLTGLEANRENSGVSVSWTPAVESNVDHYIVAYGPEDDPFRERQTVTGASVTLTVPSGTVVSVKAVNGRGMESWDWARLIVN